MDQLILAMVAGAGIGWVVRDLLGRMKMDPKGVAAALTQAAEWVEETKAAHQQALASLTEAHQQQLITHISWGNQMLQAVITSRGNAAGLPTAPPEPPGEEKPVSQALMNVQLRREAANEEYLKKLIKAGFSRDDAAAIMEGQDTDVPLDLVDGEIDRDTVRATKVT